MDDYNISYFIWNLSNKAETSALISSSCSKLSGFADSELSDSGRWYKEVLIKQREDK
jgi:endoglucanase